MSNSWFRMYAEFANDPKVQMMTEQYQRRLIMLLCTRCNGDVTLQDEEVAFQLRIGCVEWSETKADFIKRGFIDSGNKVLNWDKRQYRSDSSAERVRKHRDTKKQPDVTLCNVTETPPEQIQNRTDKEVVTKTVTTKRVRNQLPLDDLGISHNADWLAEKRIQGHYINHDEVFVLEKFKNYCKSKGKKYADYLAGYRNAFDWEQCQPRKAIVTKPTFRSEAERISAQYLAEPEPGGQGATDDGPSTSLRITEAIRKDCGQSGNAGIGFSMAARGSTDEQHYGSFEVVCA